MALLLTALPLHGARGATPAASIDGTFAAWDKPGSPGCALAVVNHGALAYSRGYGSANLEHRIPIDHRSVFDIGSVSKQFTAMSIVLLAQEGKLSLDDDIHRSVPELPDYGAAISLRQMLHHQSGLPSYTDLFDLAGVPETDLTTDDDALALIARQRTLNFVPGRQYLYSDTNYFLLALVVKRVSGQSLRAFAQQRIFAPLGMRSTHYHDDHGMIVPRRATGYAPRAGGGFAIDMSNFEELGDGSVMTTLDDMLLWDRNFREPRVGGQQAIAQLEELGVRSDGSTTPYAMGQVRDRYRGNARIQHTGEWVGYRAAYLRFPERKLSVILLCNCVGDLDALALSERVADHYLAGTAAGPALPGPPAGTSSPGGDTSATYAGRYWNAQALRTFRFDAADGALRVLDDDGAYPLQRLGGASFGAGNSASRYDFGARDGRMTVAAINDDGDPVILERIDAAAPAAAASDLQAYAGSYYSTDLGVSWTLAVEDHALTRRQWRFPTQTLRPQFGDVFSGDLSEGSYTLQFTRGADGRVLGFAVATPMVRPLRFERCEPSPTADAGPIGLACKTSAPGHVPR